MTSATGQSMNRRENAAEVGWAPMILIGLAATLLLPAAQPDDDAAHPAQTAPAA